MGASSSAPAASGGAETVNGSDAQGPPVDVFVAPESPSDDQSQARSPADLPESSPAESKGGCGETDTPDTPLMPLPAAAEARGESERADPVHVHIHMEIPREEVLSTPKQGQGDYPRMRLLDPRSPTENRTPMIATHAE